MGSINKRCAATTASCEVSATPSPIPPFNVVPPTAFAKFFKGELPGAVAAFALATLNKVFLK